MTSQGPLDGVVARLRAVGTDTRHVEARAAAGGFPRSCLKTLSAFSNTGGGLLILGLDEERGFQPAEGFAAQAVAQAVAEVMRPRRLNELPGPLVPAPVGDVEVVPFEGASVVLVEVSDLPAHRKPCFIATQGKEAGSYERLSDGNHRMSTYTVFLHTADGAQPSEDARPVSTATIADLDAVQVERFIGRLRRTRPRAIADLSSIEHILRRQRVITAEGAPTLAGLLTLGRFPQEHFPQLMVTFASYPGSAKDDVVGDLRMLDRRVVEGTIPEMVDECVAVVVSNLRMRRVSQGAGAADVLEMPVDALREAVVNALTHRDYSHFAVGDQVRIEMFPDRVEIISPGGIWGGRQPRDLFDGTSRSRNAVLSKLLMEVPFRDRDETVSENAGSGIPRMAGSMGRMGLSVPRFDVSTTRVAVHLDRYGLLDPGVQEWLTSIGAAGLPREQQSALALLHQGHELHDQVLRFQLAMDSADAAAVLEHLARDGWLFRRPGARPTYTAGSRVSATRPLTFEEVPRPLSADERLVAIVVQRGEVSAQELASELGVSVGGVRNRLSHLVRAGLLVPTAPPTSKLRRYRSPEGGVGSDSPQGAAPREDR
jgi:ATP-dependent DNA helicase RecG